MATTLTYATTAQFASAISLLKLVPSRDVGTTPANEEVGTGDGSAKSFYLAHGNIIAATYTIYYGADSSASDELTVTTHFTLDKDSGQLTLTSAGGILVSTNNLYAAYSYTDNLPDSLLNSVLVRAQLEVDGEVNSTFTDGTSTNPTYPLLNEVIQSEGYFEDRVITKEKPLIDVSSTIDGDVDISQNTIDVASGTGAHFPATGYAIIGSEVITYTGITTDQLTGVTRGVYGDAQTHTDLDAIHSTCFLKSDTQEGSAAVWTVQPWDTNMHTDSQGMIYSFEDVYPFAYNSSLSRKGVANRTKIIYLHGYPTIPEDITRLTLIFAKRQLIQDSIGKALISGRDEFKPEMFNVDTSEINRIVGKYIVIPTGNT